MNDEFCIMSDNQPYWSNHRQPGLHRHEAFFGRKNRQKSIDDGLVVFLTYDNHEGTNGVHGKNGHELDVMIKQAAQRRWMEYYDKDENEFRKRYGKNYL